VYVKALGLDSSPSVPQILTVPCFGPVNTLQVHKNTLEFGNSQCRMGVVELDCHLVWEFAPITL